MNDTSQKKISKKIALTGLFIAINILFLQVIKIDLPTMRIELGAVALAMSAIFLGPSLAVICAIISDVIGFWIVPSGYPFFAGYTFNYAVAALIFALFLSGNKYSLKNAVIAFCIEGLIIEIGFTAIWQSMLLGKAWQIILYGRIIKALIFTPIYILITHLLQMHLVKAIPEIK